MLSACMMASFGMVVSAVGWWLIGRGHDDRGSMGSKAAWNRSLDQIQVDFFTMQIVLVDLSPSN